MYETVNTVNGYDIKRMKGTHGAYHFDYNESKSYYFNTQKAAAAFAASLPPKADTQINSMCLNCKRYKNGCNGETNAIFTGCIYKEI